MDADRIYKLKGRELDAAVAEAKGWNVKTPPFGCEPVHEVVIEVEGKRFSTWPPVTHWHEDFTAAIALLLEMMAHRPGELNLVCFCNGDGDSYDIDAWRGHAHLRVDTEKEIPAMIARAWLQWKGASDGR